MATFNTAAIHAASATDADIHVMRDWLKDCGNWANMEPEDFDELTPTQVVRAVERHYFGGVVQFYKDGSVEVR